MNSPLRSDFPLGPSTRAWELGEAHGRLGDGAGGVARNFSLM